MRPKEGSNAGQQRPKRAEGKIGMSRPDATVLHFGDLDLDRHSASIRGPKGNLELSIGEFRPCAVLIEAAGNTVSRAELAEVSGAGLPVSWPALEKAISRLRKHLLARGSTVSVVAARGIGWRLVLALPPPNRTGASAPRG